MDLGKLSTPQSFEAKTSLSRNLDKENGINLNISGSLSKSKGLLHSQSVQQNDARKPSPLTSRESPLSRVSPSTGKPARRGFLRFGETVEVIFGLTPSCCEEHGKLCRQISDGTSTDNPNVWKQVFEYTKTASSLSGKDIVRLYRRATSRFTTAQRKSKESDAIFELWIDFARAQIEQRDYKDARRTLAHVRNLKLGETKAMYYTTLSDLENRESNTEVAISCLKEGIEVKAEPQNILQEALARMNKSVATTSSCATPKKRKRNENQQISPKRQNLNIGYSVDGQKAVTEECPSDDAGGTDTSNMSLGTADDGSPSIEVHETKSIRFQLAPLSDKSILSENPNPANLNRQAAVPTAAASAERKESVSNVKSVPEKATFNKPAAFTPRQTGFTLKTTRITTTSGGLRRPPLLSKAPRFAKADLGKAVRVDPNQSLNVDSESESEMTSSTPIRKSKKEQEKVSKMDLTYIYQWDPFQKGKSSGKSDQTSEKTAPKLSPLRSVVDTPSTNASGTSNGSTGSISNHSGRTDLERSLHTNAQCPASVTRNGPNEHGMAPPAQLLDAKFNCNRDFLPLVDESNMLRVNDVPYAKLGVIGKGGSCKVYRALAKDCSVYAIKRVKIGGMDKKAIDGYSNEIGLLKRLRGSPAIIQLYDSEVDLQRKSIFLVMEVGEVDLNHVLQQQAANNQDGPGSQRNLNMNFIRLTWQQMLSAVHCIHEERIIHGDLKPANFLFVRGALKLIDFGIAKAIQSDDTTNIYRENQIGTLNYMSPEAILNSDEGIKIGRASDIWSLGCILYQMIVGRTPFAELHMLQKLQAIVNPKHKIHYPENVDADALDVIQQCLRRNPSERPPIVGSRGLLNENSFLN